MATAQQRQAAAGPGQGAAQAPRKTCGNLNCRRWTHTWAPLCGYCGRAYPAQMPEFAKGGKGTRSRGGRGKHADGMQPAMQWEGQYPPLRRQDNASQRVYDGPANGYRQALMQGQRGQANDTPPRGDTGSPGQHRLTVTPPAGALRGPGGAALAGGLVPGGEGGGPAAGGALFPPPRQQASGAQGLGTEHDVVMTEGGDGAAGQTRGGPAVSDKVQKTRLTKDWEHFARNYGRDSEQAREAAARLAHFEEQAKQRARASKTVGQLLSTAVQEMQAARKRYHASVEDVKAAQAGLAEAEALAREAQRCLEATQAASCTARDELAEAEQQVAALELQRMPEVAPPRSQPETYVEVLADLCASLTAIAQAGAQGEDRQQAVKDLLGHAQRLQAAAVQGLGRQGVAPGTPQPEVAQGGDAQAASGSGQPCATPGAAAHPDGTAASAAVSSPTGPRGGPQGGDLTPTASAEGAPATGGEADGTTTPLAGAVAAAAGAGGDAGMATQPDTPTQGLSPRGRAQERGDSRHAAGYEVPRSRSSKSGRAVRLRGKTEPSQYCS